MEATRVKKLETVSKVQNTFDIGRSVLRSIDVNIQCDE